MGKFLDLYDVLNGHVKFIVRIDYYLLFLCSYFGSSLKKGKRWRRQGDPKKEENREKKQRYLSFISMVLIIQYKID